jgi:hypothetical protein
VRIALVADTHLSSRSPESVAQWHATRRAIQRIGVDLTVHLGAVTPGGPFCSDELRVAAQLIGQWPTEMRCLIGNRNNGDGGCRTGLSDHWLRAWLRACQPSLGSDHWWVLRTDGWLLLGIDAQILGSGFAKEQSLWRQLDDEVGRLSAAPRTAVFLHWPDGCGGHAAPSPGRAGWEARRAHEVLLGGPLAAKLELVVCVHRAPAIDAATGVRQFWLPPTVPGRTGLRPNEVDEKLVGVGLLELGRDEIGFDLWCPDGITRYRGGKLPLGRAGREEIVVRSTSPIAAAPQEHRDVEQVMGCMPGADELRGLRRDLERSVRGRLLR